MTAEEYRQSETQSEEDIQKAVVEWADRQAAAEPALELLFHVPNGGSRHIAEATKLKAMGTRQGVPDLLLPVPRLGGHDAACERIEYNGLALELKSSNGRLRPEQAWWLDRLEEAGWMPAVAWTFNEARFLLRSYLNGEVIEQSLDLTIAEAPRHVQ
jgi:hypothetical protein